MTHAPKISLTLARIVVALLALALLTASPAPAEETTVEVEPGERVVVTGLFSDTDFDGKRDNEDNCALSPNLGQADMDDDGQGDICDSTDDRPDTDGDGKRDYQDNCSSVVNPGQEDTDGDHIGNACDGVDNRPDDDLDGFVNVEDNCDLVSNPSQDDKDGDGIGNVCDPTDDRADGDSDGTANVEDTCPTVPNSDQDAGTPVEPGDDLAAIVNAHGPGATDFCVAAGTYPLSTTATLDPEDDLLGEAGTLSAVGPATKPAPVVHITNPNMLSTLVSSSGGNHLQWFSVQDAVGLYKLNWNPGDQCNAKPTDDGLRCPLAGTGRNVAIGESNGDTLVRYVESFGADAVGFNGGATYDSSYAHDNADNLDFVGFTGAGWKADEVYVVRFSVAQNNGGVGVWCDQDCTDIAYRDKGFHVYASAILGNRRGYRFEWSPMVGEGVHANSPSALLENNAIHGNTVEGAGVRDAQNAGMSPTQTVPAGLKNNVFGPGLGYPDNGIGINVSDSGRADRTDLWNADVENNTMNGDPIKGCELPDDVVACSNNTQ